MYDPLALLNEHLQATLQFQPADLRANRAGRLTRRQQALLAATRSTSWLAGAIFLLVMVGSGGFIAFSILRTPISAAPSPAEDAQTNAMLIAGGIVAAVILVAIIFGWATSRRHIASLSVRQISVAEGYAANAMARNSRWRVDIGPTRLRLASPQHLAAFRPGVSYRVYYLAGPVATVLSAEVANATAPADGDALEPEEAVAQDPAIQLARGARWVLIILGLLVVEIPVVAIAMAGLPDWARWLIVIALLAEAIGFVWLALWWLLRRP